MRDRLRPWRTQPGHVRVPSDRLIELLRGALRATELGIEIAGHEAQKQRAMNAERAQLLLAEQSQAACGPQLQHAERAALLDDLPQTTDGDLHEPAFLALVGHALLARRLTATIPTIGDHR